MATYTEKGDTIKGSQIVGVARKITNPVVIVQSGRHKSQRVNLNNNAMCRISRKLKFIK